MDNKRYGGMSMGAWAPETPCSLCGLVGSHSHKMAGGRDRVFRDGVEFLPLSMVPGPRCTLCDAEMLYLRHGTAWACQNTGCNQYDVAVETGIGGIVTG